MQPDIHLNYLALFAALIVKAVLGRFWYGRFFSQAWNRERGLDPAREPAPLKRWTLILRWAGLALTVYVLALGVQILRPSTWGAGVDGPDAAYGFLAALFVWAGFYLPQLFARVAWEGASVRFLRIHAFYHFVALQLAALILAHWH